MMQAKGAVPAILLTIMLLFSASADAAQILTRIKIAYQGTASPLALLRSGGRRMLFPSWPAHPPAKPAPDNP